MRRSPFQRLAAPTLGRVPNLREKADRYWSGLAVQLLAGIRLQIAALDDIEMLARRGVPDSKGTVRVVLADV